MFPASAFRKKKISCLPNNDNYWLLIWDLNELVNLNEVEPGNSTGYKKFNSFK